MILLEETKGKDDPSLSMLDISFLS